MRRTRVWLLLAAACTAVCASAQAGRNPPSTVEQVAESNGLKANGIGRVRTPSVLRVEAEGPVPADARSAIDQYDRLLALPADAVDAELRAEALRRAADLRVQLADADAASGKGFHVGEVRRAIADYTRLLREQPGYAGNDRVLYQLARAHALVGENAAAIAALQRLGRDYPQSARAGDGLFRAGEMLFARGRYRDAEQAYAPLLALGRDAPFHDYAQYKYAWALYKQAQFERAAEVFLAILERDLPSGVLEDPAAALAAVPRERAERARESLRVAALCFAALGGGPALNEYLEQPAHATRLETVLYAALGQSLLDKERYSDAAGASLAFAERHPQHALAPRFEAQAIVAYRAGGFGEQALRAQAHYAERYAPDAAYWSGRAPDPAVLAQVRQDFDELGRYEQSQGQSASDAEQRRTHYLAAAGWYRRQLDLFADDPQRPQTSLLLADALLEGGQKTAAARQYAYTAYDLPAHAEAPAAALAAVQTWQGLVREADPAQAGDARRAAIAAALQLAERFPAHPQRTPVLLTAAEDQIALGDLDAAVASAQQALDAHPDAAQQRGALGVIADARYAQQRYPEAEAAYAKLVALPAPSEGLRKLAVEQLAASVYRQGEAARDGGDLRAAAQTFARVAGVAPDASIRAAADYDAASAWSALQDWPQAAAALEAFRQLHPEHPLLPDVDKKLALAYQKQDQAARAAPVFERIAQRETEHAQTRRLAAWTAATLYDDAGLDDAGWRAYQRYVAQYPQPLDEAMQARKRLAELALSARQDPDAHRHWLDAIVQADQAAGGARSALSRRLAAESSLEIGRLQAAEALRLPLRAPLDRTLALRKSATEAAVQTLERAATYGYADLTSAATYELAAVYAAFGQALLNSERPAKLSGEALEQYRVLLEEQAYPFEEKAIQAHEINLARVGTGLWNDSIRKSVTALGELSPARYGKQERRDKTYDELR